jgi:hypothetical protein
VNSQIFPTFASDSGKLIPIKLNYVGKHRIT